MSAKGKKFTDDGWALWVDGEDTSTVSALPEETQIQKETETETGRSRRNALLKALKPYVSGGRAKAIDTMMSLADVMEIVRKG